MDPFGAFMSILAGNEMAFLIGFAILILVIVTIMVWLFLRARKKAQADLLPSAPPLDAPAPEAEAAPLGKFASPREIRRSFRRGLAVYRDHVAGSRDPHLVPWFLTVGTEGAGKTALLDGLEANRPRGETLDALGRPIGCSWCYFDEAVVLDVGGDAFVRADGSRAPDGPWRSLLNMLRQYRPQRPADGIVLTISAEDLLDAGSDHGRRLASRAALIYDKLWQAQKILGVCMPVYVVVTKCDLLPSFPSFVSALPPQLRANMFGWSNPYPLDSAYRTEWMDEAFAALQADLLRTQVELFADEPNPENAQDIFLFPAHFQQIKEPLRLHLNTIFRRTAYQEAMFLRGVYFTGRGAPGGAATPLLPAPQGSGLLLPVWTGAGGGEPDAAAQPPALLPPSSGPIVFARDLFERKIFKERDLTRETARWAFERDRTQLAWQVGTGVAAALCVGLLWLGVNRMEALRAGFLPVLTALPDQMRAADASAKGGNADGPGLSESDRRRLVEDVVRGVSRADEEWRGPFLPAAWISDLEGDVASALSIGYHRVVASLVRQQLMAKGRELATGAADVAVPAGASPEMTRLKTMLGEAALFERFVNVYNGITGTPDLTGLPELLQYAYDYELPPEFLRRAATLGFTVAPSNQALHGASLDAVLRPIDLTPYRGPAAARLEQLADAYITRIGDGSTSLNRLREVAAEIDAVLRSQRRSTDIADAYRRILDGLHGASSGFDSRDALLVGTGRDFGPDVQPLLDLIADLKLFGPEVRDRLVARIEAALARAASDKRPIDSALGPLASFDGTRNRVHLAPIAESLRKDLDALFARPFMEGEAGAGIDALFVRGGQFLWDIPVLESAAGLIEDFLLFQARDLPTFPKSLQNSVKAAAQRRLGIALLGAVAKAQIPLDSGSLFSGGPMEGDLRAEIRSFADAAPLFSEVNQLFRQAGMASYQSTLSQVVVDKTVALLGQVDEMMEADGLFLIPQAPLDAWAGRLIVPHELYGVRTPIALAELLADHRQRIALLARDFAAPLIEILNAPGLRGGASASPLVGKWAGILAELDGYDARRPNSSMKRLVDFVTADLGTVDLLNCGKVVEGAVAGAAGGFFESRMAEIGYQVLDRCNTLLDAEAVDGYRAIAEAFDRLLAGRPPFGPRGAGKGTAATTTEDLLAFFELFDARADRVQAALAARPRLGEEGRQAAAFIERMRQVRAFLNPLLPGGGAPDPSYRIEAKFRVNQDAELGGHAIIEWRLAVGGKAATNFGPADKLVWHPGDPVAVSLRWARDGFTVPVSAGPGTEIDRARHAVTYRFDGPWALLDLIREHAASPRDWKPGPGRPPHVLAFEATTDVAEGKGAAIQAAGGPAPLVPGKKLARVFVEVGLFATVPAGADGSPAAEKRMEMPEFPTAAPRIAAPVGFDTIFGAAVGGAARAPIQETYP